MVGLGKRLKNI